MTSTCLLENEPAPHTAACFLGLCLSPSELLKLVPPRGDQALVTPIHSGPIFWLYSNKGLINDELKVSEPCNPEIRPFLNARFQFPFVADGYGILTTEPGLRSAGRG